MEDRCIQFILIVCALFILLSFPASAIALSNPVINELLPNPEGGNKEWVELYNQDKIDLASFFLDDDTSFTDDAGSSSKKSLVSLAATESAYPYIELSSFLNNGGDFVVLFDGTGNIVDEFEFTDDPGVGVAIGRWPDGNGDFFALNQSTKGSANSQPKPTPTQIPTSTPDPTNTPKPPSPTKTPTPMRAPTPTKIPTLNQRDTSVPILKSFSKLLSKSPTLKTSISPTRISSRSATPNTLGISTKSATLTPKREFKEESKSSPFSPLIFTITGAVIFVICAILVALKIKWKQRQ